MNGEIYRAKAILQRKKLERSKVEIEFWAILKDVRYKLNPYGKIEELRLEEVKTLVERLLELQEQYKGLTKAIKEMEVEL